jgi:hypothetical protein
MATQQSVADKDIFTVLRVLNYEFWKCERRASRQIKTLTKESRKLETEILRTHDEVERASLQENVNGIEVQIELIRSACIDHHWNGASSWCASQSGFGRDEIYEAARAGFDASNIQSDSELRTVFRCLHESLRNLPEEWKSTSWAGHAYSQVNADCHSDPPELSSTMPLSIEAASTECNRRPVILDDTKSVRTSNVTAADQSEVRTATGSKKTKRGPSQVSHDRTKKELVKSVLQLHHDKSDDTITVKPLTHRQIEEMTKSCVSDTTAGRILNEWFDPVGGYRKACEDGIVVTRLNALDDGLKFIQTLDPSTLAENVTADGKSTRSHRKSKPVDDD